MVFLMCDKSIKNIKNIKIIRVPRIYKFQCEHYRIINNNLIRCPNKSNEGSVFMFYDISSNNLFGIFCFPCARTLNLIVNKEV
jgi:hypothetical protein